MIKGKSSSESPAFPAQSKLLPSPLSQSVSHKDSPHLSNSISPSSLSAPISKTKDSPKAPSSNAHTSPSSCPPAPKRRKVSSSPEGMSSHRSRKDSKEHVKPVISPIHFGDDRPICGPICMGSEDSNSEASQNGSSPRENGVLPKQYRGDFSKHSSRSKHHGHRHHHHSNTAAPTAASKSRHERRHHHPRETEQTERAGRNSRRDHHHSSKRRRTELDRYR